jgi:hypothetical protein
MDCLPHIHTYAYHAEGSYNSITPGIGALCTVARDTHLGVGTYRNSINRQSEYVAIAYQPVKIGPVSIGALAGGVTGYKPYMMPMGGLMMSAPVGPVTVHTLVIPKNNVGPMTVSLSFTFKL